MTDNHRSERVSRGNLDLTRDETTGKWQLAWAPDYGEPDWPGHTYSPDDDDLPSDYPDSSDAEALIEWGQRHFGS